MGKCNLYRFILLLFFITPSSFAAIDFYGDLRLRTDYIDDETEVSGRLRERLRARFGLLAPVHEKVSLKLELASGDSAQDGTSQNQTLGSAWNRKDIAINLAYFRWTPCEFTQFTLGKQEFSFHKAGQFELLWDDDLNPEGAHLSFRTKGEYVSLESHLGGFWILERHSSSSHDSDDVMLYGLQLGSTVTPWGSSETPNPWGFYIGASTYSFNNILDRLASSIGAGARGNTTTAGGNYANAYHLVEGIFELNGRLGPRPFQWSLDTVINTRARNHRSGWLTGFRLGSTKTKGDWALKYSYRRLEADAMVGAFSDSDTFGGGTEGKGHKFSLDYAIEDKIKLVTSFYLSYRQLVNETSYKRMQVDLNFKF